MRKILNTYLEARQILWISGNRRGFEWESVFCFGSRGKCWHSL